MLVRGLVLLLLVLPTSALAWGFGGHRRLASNTHEPFAQGSCLRAWLQQVTGSYTWQDKACDPDRWRSTDSDEWPRHYLDIDWSNPIEAYPREWEAVVDRFGQYAVKNGTVPFRVEEMYRTLVQDFQAKNGTKALDTVAYLSHYVTDACSVMHDTKNQPGNLHTRYESDMLSTQSRMDSITSLARTYYGTVGKADPRNHIFDIIIVGNPLAQNLIASDESAAGDETALYNNSREMTARRWGDALTLMASLIGTAWVEAGKPILTGMPNGCSSDVPQGEVVLKGYALPPPYVPPDAGAQEPDAGTPGPDGGTGADGGGGGIGIDDWDAGTGGEVPADGCQGCGGGPVAALFPVFALGFALAARRRW